MQDGFPGAGDCGKRMLSCRILPSGVCVVIVYVFRERVCEPMATRRQRGGEEAKLTEEKREE